MSKATSEQGPRVDGQKDFVNFTTLKPGPHLESTVTAMLDQVIALRAVLKQLRAPKSE